MTNPIIIGIAGGTCSGKSTLASMLKDTLTTEGYTVKLINMDSYFREISPTTVSPFSGKTYPEHNHPDCLDLPKLFSDFEQAISANAHQIVIIEGVFALLLDEIRTKLDYKIYVDLPDDERFYRRIKRFSKDFNQTFDEIAERYLDTVRHRHNELVEPTRWHADLVINGTLATNKGFDLLTTAIKSLLTH